LPVLIPATSIWAPEHFDLEHAGVYEGLLRDPTVSPMLGTFYAAMDLTTSSQMFIREVTPDLLKALSS
jgi:hypothetical protein